MDAAMPRDPHAIDGKFAAPDEHARLLVIGAGAAGLAAATRAAELGLTVLLVDENPVPSALMGLDVPLFYGQRMNPAVQDQARMIERLVAASPAIEAAFDAGVDLRLGVAAWGAFANGDALSALPGRVVGLADGARSWMCGFDALILATGARDLVLGFEGVDLPGVTGALGLHSLLARYDAFDGRRLLILGSGDLALDIALAALDRGLEVAALVEALPEPQAPPERIAALAARGVRIRTGAVIVRAEGGPTGVRAALLSTGERIECDTVCLALGAVPAIELGAALGLRLDHRGDLGGHVPLIDAHGATSLAGVFCAGDCAGLSPAADPVARGQAAAAAAAAWLAGEPAPAPPAPAPAGTDATAYRLDWMRALVAAGEATAPACLCEEVSRAELLGVRPPRYLGCAAGAMAARDSRTLLRDGPLDPDQFKRLTRAGMGPCQGRRCREQIALLLALASDTPVGSVPLASYRAPVRPLPLGLLADPAETAAMRQGWDVWFGIRTQWIPYDLIGTDAEAALLRLPDGGTGHA